MCKYPTLALWPVLQHIAIASPTAGDLPSRVLMFVLALDHDAAGLKCPSGRC